MVMAASIVITITIMIVVVFARGGRWAVVVSLMAIWLAAFCRVAALWGPVLLQAGIPMFQALVWVRTVIPMVVMFCGSDASLTLYLGKLYLQLLDLPYQGFHICC